MNRASSEALARKNRSISRLEREGIPVNQHLPVIETAKEARLRSKDEVVTRALALTTVAEKGATQDHELAVRMAQAFEIETSFTPREQVFITNPKPTSQDLVQFSWRYEGFGVMLWALSYLHEMGKPAEPFEAPKLARILIDLGAKEFRRKSAMRPAAEVLDAADLIYRYNWAVTDARINRRSPPGGLNASVVYERHYALNWLIGYQGQDWDDVSIDT